MGGGGRRAQSAAGVWLDTMVRAAVGVKRGVLAETDWLLRAAEGPESVARRRGVGATLA